MCACGLLFVGRGDEDARFDREREHGHSRGLRLSLCGALVLTAMAVVVAAAAAARAIREVALLRRGDVDVG